MKKFLKIFIPIVLVISVCMFLCSCENSKDENSKSAQEEQEKEVIIETKQDAIDYVMDTPEFYDNREMKSCDDCSVKERLIEDCRFVSYYEPEITACEVENEYNRGYLVIIKGKISGYVDEYETDFRTMKFAIPAAIVKEDWSVKIEKIRICDENEYFSDDEVKKDGYKLVVKYFSGSK